MRRGGRYRHSSCRWSIEPLIRLHYACSLKGQRICPPKGQSLANIMSNQLENPLEQRLGFNLRRASLAMMLDYGEQLSKHDVRPAEASILTVVLANPDANQADVARCLEMKRANMVPLIIQLVAKGWLERHPIDRRRFALRLTATGRSVAKKVQMIMENHERDFIAALDPVGFDEIIATLRRLRGTK
ncbi:MAG: MarR family transcriptional regulator [Sphingobium sp.]|nr:MarR family transcriptional regulator [Sphingobium sp.]